MNARNSGGFTLVELLVVLVLGTLLVLATYQSLATNTRVYGVNTARAVGQQTLRGGMAVLSSELREISTPGGDLVRMSPDEVGFRAQRAFGLVCNVDYVSSPAKITTITVGPAFVPGDSVFVLHDNNPDLASDDEWFGGIVSAVANNAVCGGTAAQILTVPFLSATAAASPPDSVRVGAPVRAFEIFTLGQYEIEGDTYLGRRTGGDTSPDLLAGPLAPSGGVSFRYLDSGGKATTVDTLVSQILVTLRYQSDLRDFQSEPVTDSLLIRVFPRN